jgi:AcrR family transcriptional regulator
MSSADRSGADNASPNRRTARAAPRPKKAAEPTASRRQSADGPSPEVNGFRQDWEQPNPQKKEPKTSAVSNGTQATRGGWKPVGTAARRRDNFVTSGTKRGHRTRSTLLTAARTVFEQKGYFDTGVADIVREAQCSHGTFYSYFTSKQVIFREVYEEIDAEIRQAVAKGLDDVPGETHLNLDRAHRRWLSVYRRNAVMIAFNEQASIVDEQLHKNRLAARQFHVARVASTIKRWQERGLADTSIDSATAAGALVSMNSNFAYWWIVGGDTYDESAASAILTTLWINALKLKDEPSMTRKSRTRRSARPSEGSTATRSGLRSRAAARADLP